MILTEQKYKRYYRTYYHGSPYSNIDKARAKFSAFYLTTSFEYALEYAWLKENSYGTIFECCLKKDLDLFNGNSKSDLNRLTAKIRSYNKDNTSPHVLSVLPIFKRSIGELGRKDFIDLFMSKEEIREIFVGILKDAGFDGFFNFEITNKVSFFYDSKNHPAIGIFDIDNVIIKKSSSGEDIKELDGFSKVKSREVNLLKHEIVRLHALHPELTESDLATYFNYNKINDFIIKSNFKTLSKKDIEYTVIDVLQNGFKQLIEETTDVWERVRMGERVTYHGFELKLVETEDIYKNIGEI